MTDATTQTTENTEATAADTSAMGDAAVADTATDTPKADDAAAAKTDDAAKNDAAAAAAGKTDADAKADDKPSIVGAPEAYDFKDIKLPEGQQFDTEMFGAIEPILKDMDLSQDGANKLIAGFAEKAIPVIAQRQQQQMDDAGAEIRANLARDLQADPEVGGAKLDESKSMAAKALSHFIPDASQRSEFSTFLNESGLGNHPLLMRVVAGAGRALSEATATPGGNVAATLSPEEKFFGKQGGN